MSEAVINTQSCVMERKESEEAVEAGPPGSFYIEKLAGGVTRMWHKLPNGNFGVIYLRPIPPSMNTNPSWEWDGNETAPTLTPSVHLPGSWHGWFTAGRMQSC